MKIDEKSGTELAHWAPVSGPQEPEDVTEDAPAHQVIAVTSGGNLGALEVQEKTGSNVQEPNGIVKLGSTAATPPPATSSRELRGRLSHQPDDPKLDGQHSVLRPTVADEGETSSLGNRNVEDLPASGES